MISIFHGNNNFQSRLNLNKQIDTFKTKNILRLDKKTIDTETINNFLNTTSFFQDQKILVIDGFFSIPKSKKRQQLEDILSSSDHQIFIWHSKKLTVSQLKTFPKAKASSFNLSNQLFSCVYSIKPDSLNNFLSLYKQIKNQEPFELILHLIKQNLRKQLVSWSNLPQDKLKTAYLHLIELDYQAKTGQLVISKESALERIIINLLK